MMATEATDETGSRSLPSLPFALLPVVLTLGLLALQLFYYGDFTPHIPLITGLAITSLLGVLRGMTWMDIREGIFHVIHVSMPSLAVLIVVGMIIGVWIASGTVPTLIYFGLVLLNPSIFLGAAMILCGRLAVAGHKLGHGRNHRSRADGHRGRLWHPSLLDGRRGRVLTHSPFQDTAP